MREVGPRAPERPEGSRPQLPFSSPEGALYQPSVLAGYRRSCLAVSAVESSASRRGREPPVR